MGYARNLTLMLAAKKCLCLRVSLTTPVSIHDRCPADVNAAEPSVLITQGETANAQTAIAMKRVSHRADPWSGAGLLLLHVERDVDTRVERYA
jgi:hypothetical protein